MVYTGIVQQVGKAHFEAGSKSSLIVETEETFWRNAKSGDSVCVDGVCLTLTEDPVGRIGRFCVMEETRTKTTLSNCDNVNLERSLQHGDEIGGHLISGHVTGKGKIISKTMNQDLSWDIWLELCKIPFQQYPIVTKGSITCHGISLTVAELTESDRPISNGFSSSSSFGYRGPVKCRVSITPYTYSHTNICHWKVNEFINLEYDQALQLQIDAPPPTENSDEYYMKRAIQLAELGRLTAPPNPWVGCVIVDGNGDIIGEGFHKQAGFPHAEVNAIENAESGSKTVEGCTVFVTLEPCHHTGRTPPCDKLLVEKGIKRVVIGYIDPDHRVSNQGVTFLEKNNISVTTGVCSDLVEESLLPYLKQRERKRPYCVAKAAISIDGRINCGDGTSQWITGQEARIDAHNTLRAFSQAIMVGTNTAVLDKPQLTIRTQQPAKQPLRVIVDTKGRVTSGPLMDTTLAPTVIFTSRTVAESSVLLWREKRVHVEFVNTRSTDGRADLNKVFQVLAVKYGVIQLLVEGGSVLQGELLRLGLIDEFVLYQGSIMIGNRGTHWCNTNLCSSISNAKAWKLLQTKQIGSDVRLTYRNLAEQTKDITQTEIIEPQLCVSSIEDALEKFSKGEFVIVMDDIDRENEGDLIIAAQDITPEKMALMIRHGTGIVCTPMTADHAQRLKLPRMVQENQDPKETAFTVSCDSKNTSTGVSAVDRSTTVYQLSSFTSKPEEFTRPGHIFPLIAVDGGVLERSGHTEASIELCKLAGKRSIACICELMKDNGEMMRFDSCVELSKQFNIPIITVQQIIEHVKQKNSWAAFESMKKANIKKLEECSLPIRRSGKDLGTWRLISYQHILESGAELTQIALTLGEIEDSKTPVLTRIHSQCFTGDLFGSARCDCGDQLHKSMQIIAEHGTGIVIYVDGHEGRGIGLINKIRAYDLMQKNPTLDTFQANKILGFPEELRTYEGPLAILKDLNIKEIRLLTNNPEKFRAFYSLVKEIIPLRTPVYQSNRMYLKSKETRAQQTISPEMKQLQNLSFSKSEFDLEPSEPAITKSNETTAKETSGNESVTRVKKDKVKSPVELPPGCDVSGFRVAVIYTMWNRELVDGLRIPFEAIIKSYGVQEENIVRMEVPGSWELPFACETVAMRHNLDVIVCFGVLLKGDTLHFEMISGAVSQSLMNLQSQLHIPITYGVLNCLTNEQAMERCGPDSFLPHSLACSALHMANNKQKRQ